MTKKPIPVRTFSLSDDGALSHLIEAAKTHGEDSDPDHEVGDLQDLLRDVWGRLSEDQRRDFLLGDAVSSVLETSGCAEDLPLIHGTWNHLFGIGRQETTVRLLFDRREHRIVSMKIVDWPYDKDATASEIADVEDSLKNGNPDALDDPEAYGLSRAYVAPVWANAEDSQNQSRREAPSRLLRYPTPK